MSTRIRHRSIQLVLICLIAVALSGCSRSVQKTNEAAIGDPSQISFSFVFESIYVEDDNDILLLGTLQPGEPITLLAKDTSKFCSADVIKSEKLETDAATTIEYNRLGNLSECGPRSMYSVGTYGEQVFDYEVIHMEKETDQTKVDALDKTIRSTGLLEKFLDDMRSLAIGADELPQSPASVYRYPMRDADVYIVTYGLDGYWSNNGPRIAVIDDKPYMLTGWCSYPSMRTFRLNGHYYIESGSACCGCGWTAQQIFRITPGGLVHTHYDTSLSD